MIVRRLLLFLPYYCPPCAETMKKTLFQAKPVAGDSRENAPTCAVTVCLAWPTCHRLFHGSLGPCHSDLKPSAAGWMFDQVGAVVYLNWQNLVAGVFQRWLWSLPSVEFGRENFEDDRVAAFDPTGPYLTNEIVLKGTGISGEHLPMSWKGPGVDVCSWWVARFLTVSH